VITSNRNFLFHQSPNAIVNTRQFLQRCSMQVATLSRKRPAICFLALFILSAALNLAAFRLLRAKYTSIANLDFDEQEYWNIATRLMDSEIDTLHGLRTMGFPLVLAAARSIIGDRYQSVQIVVTLIFSLSAPFFYRFMRRETGNELAGLLAGFCVACWPSFIWYAITLYSETVAIPAFVAYLWLAPPRGQEQSAPSRPIRWLLAGLMLAFCLHVRPMFLIYTPVAGARALFNGCGIRSGVRHLILLGIGCAVAVLPWSFYISREQGKPIILCANDGRTIGGSLTPRLFELDGQVRKTPGDREYRVAPGKWLDMNETGYLTPEETKLPVAAKSQIVMDRAMTWSKANPGAALYLTVRKVMLIWGIYPFWNGLVQTLFGNVPVLMLIGLSLVTVVRFRQYLPELSSLWTLPIFSTGVAVLTSGSWRFRMPGDLGLIGLAVLVPLGTAVLSEFAARKCKVSADALETATDSTS